jgi:hypothetical protein
MNYSEKLKDPRWQRKRLEIMQRDDFTCQLCGDKESTLHVHNKSYNFGKDPWEYDDSNFITYCEICHLLVEANKHQPIKFLKVEKYKGGDANTVFVGATFDYQGKIKVCLNEYKNSEGTLQFMVTLSLDGLENLTRLLKESDSKGKSQTNNL